MIRAARFRSLAGPVFAGLIALVGATAADAQSETDEAGRDPIPPIERRIPPVSEFDLPEEDRQRLQGRVGELTDRVWEIDFKEQAADAGALVKAVALALEHGEFYREADIELAYELLDLAEQRHRLLSEEDAAPWAEAKGLVVRGFRSRIDDSYQPLGLEIPEGLDLDESVPLLVWLHGRGDKVTDMHFIERCRTRSQAFGGLAADQEDAIVLHPFGRHCVGWKHAGEIDVFEAIERVAAEYPIDRDRIALAGFSMGGAGAWHIGAHYRDRFCAVHAGAGFAETREYNRIAEEDLPPAREQILWQLYDVPSYARNLLNGPLLAYSGSEDKQKQAADLMARELAEVGHELRHVIGEGMGHQYDEASVDEIRAWLREAWERGRDRSPERIIWETPTLRYPGFAWLRLESLDHHWKPSLVTAEWREDTGALHLELENVTSVTIGAGAKDSLAGERIWMGSQMLAVEDPGFPVDAVSLQLREGEWRWGEPTGLRKRPGLQGPIDDAFLDTFLVIPPERETAAEELTRWVDFELDHFRTRWKALMRGELPEESARDLDSGDIREANLVLWGDPRSNPLLDEIVDRLPIRWEEDRVEFRGQRFSTRAKAPVFIFPNPLQPDRYVVINSGLTFREDHDRTNSLQNPKLPDWAIIGLDVDPDGAAPGRVLDSGFFTESWK